MDRFSDSASGSASVRASVSASVRASVLTGSAPRLAYRVFGDRGAPVLFVMGFGMSGRVWGPQVDELQRDHRCCHYDHLGVGDSERGPLFPTIHSMAGDGLRIMDDLCWDRAHVVGVSMGGMIAQELALSAPDRCRTLTLIATHGGVPFGSLPTLAGMWLFMRGLFGGKETRLRSVPRLLYPDEYLNSIDPIAFKAHMNERLGKPASLRTIVGHLQAVWRHRTESRLSQIDLPTLLVRPGKDILIRPTQTDRLAKRIPHAEVLRFDDAGHGVTFQKATELNAALRAHFLRDQN
ncbi:MAG: alpha/beta hydrolase [Myxococcales bacterium]|nr:alpha/beta hydrolase [Myxococcales bacterium]MDH3842526.1 alpha/beta hydrolase [Myxococcales bacterium]